MSAHQDGVPAAPPTLRTGRGEAARAPNSAGGRNPEGPAILQPPLQNAIARKRHPIRSCLALQPWPAPSFGGRRRRQVCSGEAVPRPQELVGVTARDIVALVRNDSWPRRIYVSVCGD